MASVITATTTSGLTQSADNSGVLQLASGAGNLVTVPSVTGTAMVSGNMPAFSAYISGGNQAVTNSTYTKVTFNTEEFDTASCYNTSTYRFTPNVAGYYQVNLMLFQLGGGTTQLNSYVYKNGSAYLSSQTITATYQCAPLSGLVYLNGSTDYIEAYTFVIGASGGNIAQDLTFSWFSASLVRSA